MKLVAAVQEHPEIIKWKIDGIDAVVFREDEFWVGQCLQFDICTQAGDLPTLRCRLEATIHYERAAMAKRAITIQPAPAYFWHKAGIALLASLALGGCSPPALVAFSVAAGAIAQDAGAFDSTAAMLMSWLPAKPGVCVVPKSAGVGP